MSVYKKFKLINWSVVLNFQLHVNKYILSYLELVKSRRK